MNTYPLVIGGQLVDGAGALEIINPATGEVVATCSRVDAAQVDAAVEAAGNAQPAWDALGIDERRRRLLAIAEDLSAQKDDFAQLLTMEQGKPIQQAHEEVAVATFVLSAFADMEIKPRVLHDDATRRVIEHRTALGVVAAITPWNFPLHILSAKVGPALLSGNTMVVKPAATTPLTTLKFGALCQRHLPAGVLNVVADANDLGDHLTSHPGVAKVSFTGSSATGRRVMASASGTLKHLTLELGGNDPAIVVADADPKLIAPALFWSSFYNAGQVCIAIKRIYVHDAIYDALCDEMVALANACIVGNGADAESQIGPLQNRSQIEKVSGILERVHDEGRIIAGGNIPDRPGFFVEPTIIRDVSDGAEIAKVEQFGPILPILRFSDVDDAIRRANTGDYALGASVWSADGERASEIARKLDAGTVWVNAHAELTPDVPFRGAK